MNRNRLLRAVLIASCLVLTGASAETRVIDTGPIRRWLARQDAVRTLAADFVQTRALRSLRDPIAVPGRLWFAAPESFRWELGNPPRTIVLPKNGSIFIISPAKERAERMAADALGEAAGSRGMEMMRFPIARSYEEFRERFDVLDVRTDGAKCRATLLPRDARAREFVSAITLDFDTGSGVLHAFEITTREGSSIRSEFSNVKVNGEIDRSVFDYDLSGFHVTDVKP